MMENKVLKFMEENRMIEAGESVVVGVSGGADSMCLLHILATLKDKLNIELVAVHIHHGIRGENADRDADFVEKYCGRENIPFRLFSFDVPRLAKEWGMSLEEAGRRVRYDAFGQVAAEYNGKIAVAHNANDQAETVLLNLYRGSGIKGLVGILPVRENVIRPILCLSRDEIEKYNHEHHIEYVTDETNLTEDYTRNRIRHKILPEAVSYINDKAIEHINSTAESLGIIDSYMESQCKDAFKRLVTDCEERLDIQVQGFLQEHPAMQWQLIKTCLYQVAGRAKDITKVHMSDVIKLFSMQVGSKVSLPYGMQAKRAYEYVSIKEIKAGEGDGKSANEVTVVNIQGEGEYTIKTDLGEIQLSVRKDVFCQEIFIENKYTKWVDCDIIRSNLQLRTRQTGDFIVVDEAGSKKKLKDFFIDKKIPREERDNIPLVTDGNQVLWIVGHRLSSAHKVKKHSDNIYRLHISVKLYD